MTLLEAIKVRCGIPSAITVYDSELIDLILDGAWDMKTAGVPEDLLPTSCADEDIEPQVITTIACYVSAYRGQDRTETAKYLDLYRLKLHKLMLEPDDDEEE